MKQKTNMFVKRGLMTAAIVMAFILCLTGCSQNTNQNTQTTQPPQDANKAVASLNVNCAGVIDNMDKVPANKKEYIPQDGVILNKENVEIADGDTAFSFLQKLCKENNVQMDYADGLIYVTSIGNLNEKDCGTESGWMYKVNGQAPTVGAAEYKLQNGDKVEFYYILSYAEAF